MGPGRRRTPGDASLAQTMAGLLSTYTTYLANTLCAGSSRKLIAGWWYSILGVTIVLFLMSFPVLGSRVKSEGFMSLWSGLMLVSMSIGGTMIMRKFHNSMAVGFFMGSLISMSQLFFFIFLIYLAYGKDAALSADLNSKQENFLAFSSLVQSILLGSFAMILAAHRSEILDKPSQAVLQAMDELHGIDSTAGTYEAPAVQAA